jgi:23S rRNA-/tRNA-specific pseudouridylate synthase
MSGVQQIEIRQEDADQRLDRWFKRQFPALGHGRLEKLLRTGQVRLDGKRAKAGDRVEAGAGGARAAAGRSTRTVPRSNHADRVRRMLAGRRRCRRPCSTRMTTCW